tara:strand:+ start:1308 stop:1838 length:531 start_codon:yes stop_codon:yes gene_type:complete
MKLKRNKGIVFWITGLSGSGKTTIGKKIKAGIIKNYGPTILFSGDDIRKIFANKKYSAKDRSIVCNQYSKLCQNISNQNINVIFCTVCLINKVQSYNKKNIDNYIEIFIKSRMENVRKFSNKKIYEKKYTKNIYGLDIKPQYPTKPHIIINNNFNKSVENIAKDLIVKIKKIARFK